MASSNLRYLCLIVVVFSICISSCKGQGGGGGAVTPGTQDAIQIVAQAALCLDNRTVINGCLNALGFNASRGGNGTAANGTRANGGLCSAPCFAEITLVLGCVNGALSNIKGYNPGVIQGVKAIFQMACGNVTAGATNVSSNGTSAGNPGQLTSGSDGPTVSVRSIYSTVLAIWAGIGLMMFW